MKPYNLEVGGSTMVFDHKEQSDFFMSEDQARSMLDEFATHTVEKAESGCDEAAGWAVLAFKAARHLEWVQLYCPILAGDGSAFITAVNALKAIHPTNPIAAAEAIPEIWRLLNEVYIPVVAEAEGREEAMVDGNAGPYFSEMRDLANRIEAVIRKATQKADTNFVPFIQDEEDYVDIP